jgi:hypothetical protein
VPGAEFSGTVEVARGRLSDDRAAQLIGFWTDRGALTEEQARMRLTEVVCVALDGAGDVVGVNSVFRERIPAVGGLLFWIYRGALIDPAADTAMQRAAFEALAEDFDPAGGGPVGLCLLVGDRETMESRPQVVWPETEMLLAGHLEDGTQVRVRYFEGARVGPGLPDSPTLDESRALDTKLEDRYRLVPFGEASEVGADEIRDFWLREDAVPEAEAERRIDEVHLVAVDRDDGVVGVSSAYLKRSAQLRMDLWHYRAFVGGDHRMSTLAVNLAMRGRDVLEDRFLSGADTRAPGIVYEVENDGLKRYFNLALWMPTDFTFIGQNERGAHVRVHWFPGAEAPPGA